MVFVGNGWFIELLSKIVYIGIKQQVQMHGLFKKGICEEITLEEVRSGLSIKTEEGAKAMIYELGKTSGKNVPKQCFKFILQECISLYALREALKDFSYKCKEWEDQNQQEDKIKIMEQLEKIVSKLEKSDAQLFEKIKPKQKIDLKQFVLALTEFSQYNNNQKEMKVKQEMQKHSQMEKELSIIYNAVVSNWWNKGQVEALQQSKRILEQERRKNQNTIQPLKKQIKTLYDLVPKEHDQQQFVQIDEGMEHEHMFNSLKNWIGEHRLVFKNTLFYKQIKANVLQFLKKLHSPFKADPHWIVQSEHDMNQQLDRIQEEYSKIIQLSYNISKENESLKQRIKEQEYNYNNKDQHTAWEIRQLEQQNKQKEDSLNQLRIQNQQIKDTLKSINEALKQANEHHKRWEQSWSQDMKHQLSIICEQKQKIGQQYQRQETKRIQQQQAGKRECIIRREKQSQLLPNLQESQELITILARQNQNLRTQLQKTVNSCINRDQKIKQILNLSTRHVETIERQIKQIKTLRETVQNHENTINQHQQQIDAQITDLNQQNKQKESKIRQLELKIEQLKNKLEKAQTQGSQNDEKLQKKERQSFQQIQNLRKDITDLKSQVKRLEDATKFLEGKNEQLSENLNQRQEQLLLDRKQSQKTSSKIKILQQQRFSLVERIQKYKSQIQSSKEKIAQSRDYNVYFPNEILTKQAHLRRFLIQTIEDEEHLKVQWTKLLYRWDPEGKINFHKFIDNTPNIFLLLKLKNGRMIGCYSNHAFYPGCKGGDNGLIIAINNREVFRLKNRSNAIAYDEYYIIFGNSEVRLKSSDDQVFSNFGIANSYYENSHQSVDAILGEGREVKELPIAAYEIYQIVFQQ